MPKSIASAETPVWIWRSPNKAWRSLVWLAHWTEDVPEAIEAAGASEELLLERVGVRIHSRLMEMCEPIRLTGYDYRRDVGQRSR